MTEAVLITLRVSTYKEMSIQFVIQVVQISPMNGKDPFNYPTNQPFIPFDKAKQVVQTSTYSRAHFILSARSRGLVASTAKKPSPKQFSVVSR